MAFPIARSAAAIPPPEACRINWGAALTPGLVAAVPPVTRGMDLVSGKRFDWATNSIEPGSVVGTTHGRHGRQVVASTHDYNNWGHNPIATGSDFTVMLWGRDGVGSADQITRFAWARGKDGWGSGWSAYIASSADSLKNVVGGVVWTSPSIVGRVISTTYPFNGRWVILRFQQGVRLSLFVEGYPPTHDTTSIGSSLRTSTVGIGNFGTINRAAVWDDYENRHWYGHIGDQFVWNRALKDEECLFALSNPYSLYMPVPRILYFDLARAKGTMRPTVRV